METKKSVWNKTPSELTMGDHVKVNLVVIAVGMTAWGAMWVVNGISDVRFNRRARKEAKKAENEEK